MKMIKIVAIIIALILFHISCSDSTSGGETLNEKVALYMPDGITPAIDASVKFFSIGDTSTTPIYQTQTDTEGRYTVLGVTSTGYYNVIAEYEDSLFTMQDTIFISQESHLVKDDTLNNPGTISGIVALQPNHSHLLNNVYVMALGMGRAVNVDSTGWFTMTKLAPGDYNLQVDTDIEKYGPKFLDVTISSNVNDTIADTIMLPYSGVPVVTNIRCEYDTLNGVVSVNWNKSSYGNVYSYVVFKKYIDSLFFPKDPIGWVSSTDTTYKDTIFTKPVLDTTSQYYDYTVAIIDSSTATGPINSFSKVIGISPLKVTTDITIQTFNKETQSIIDTFSTKDTQQIVLTASNSFRPYKNITWAINHPDSIMKQLPCDTLNHYLNDTLFLNLSDEDNYKLYVTIEDMAETFWKDSITIPVWNKPESVSLFLDSIFTYTAYLRWTKSSDPRFKSYNIYTDTTSSTPDTILYNIEDTALVLYPIKSMTSFTFNVSVNDSLNIQVRSNTVSEVSDSSFRILDSDFSGNRDLVGATYNDGKVYLCGGKTFDYDTSTALKFTVLDLNSNTSMLLPPMNEPKSYCYAEYFNNKIFVIGFYRDSNTKSFESFDLDSNKWSLYSIPTFKTMSTNTHLQKVSGSLFCLNYNDTSKQTELFLLDTNSYTWSYKDSFSERIWRSTVLNDTLCYLYNDGSIIILVKRDPINKKEISRDTLNISSDYSYIYPLNNNEKLHIIGLNGNYSKFNVFKYTENALMLEHDLKLPFDITPSSFIYSGKYYYSFGGSQALCPVSSAIRYNFEK